MAAGKTDYYDILGVTKEASADELKKAYRKQAMEWHPDKHQGSDKEAAEKRFKEINEAYQILSDADKRQAYDKFGHSAFSPGGAGSRGGDPYAGGYGGQSGPFRYTYTTNSANGQQFDFGDPFEIFEQFFGGGSPFGQRGPRIPRYSIDIDFMDAVNGVEKEVSIEGKKRTIKIPAGVDDGSRIQFNDFILSINVKPSATFERDGADVYVEKLVPFSALVLGDNVSVPTLKGKDLKLKIRAGTQPGSYIRLRGEGIKHLRHQGYGDLYVKVNVQVPKKLTREQKNIFKNLQEEGL